jgi:4-carboxymuconolactone decarboxylase
MSERRNTDHQRRQSSPRVAPLEPSEWDQETADRLARIEGPVPNIIATLAHHPKLLKRWTVFGNHVLAKSSLPERDREILILRTGWRCASEYEFGQHTLIGRTVGLSNDDIRRITEGPDAEGFEPFEQTLLKAADELLDDHRLSDSTWAALSDRYTTHQLMDVVFTVGQYNLVAIATNTLGVELDPGVPGFPEEPPG